MKESSTEKSQNLFEKKAKQFEKQNREKIFLFISENFQTKHLPKQKKLELIDLLIQEVKTYGGFQNVKVKSTIDFYLAQEHEVYGRNIDKIIDRYFWRMGEEKRKNESRQLFFNALKRYFPEEVTGLDDFKTNDLSKNKLDKLLTNVPSVGYFSDEYVFEEQVKGSEPERFEDNPSQKEYLNKLILEKTGGKTIALGERLEFLNEFIPLVLEKFPAKDFKKVYRVKFNFNDFKKKYSSKDT